MKIKRKGWLVLGLAVAIVVLAGLAFVYLSPRDPFFHSRAFSSEQWVKGDSHIRGEMAYDLRASKLLDGKTHAQVEALLGPPDVAGTNELSYRVDVGYRWMGSPWLYDLRVRFDPASNIVHYVDLRD